ncbi:MAG: TonB-dependent receptor [Acidobacteria bacterium]|nr:TonB-dependent receptor [Acidobacteriota bacterium]
MISTSLLNKGFLTVLGMMLLLPAWGFAQATTGAITGRVMDSSGALIPGVEVTISSPAMIGGSRNAITDERGTYRFTLLPVGVYRVSFALPGFRTLNIDSVNVTVGATMTINGTLEVAAVAEEVTVTSEAPTIDLEAATTGVNWSLQKLDTLPYGRGIRAITQLLPGIYATAYDVGGNTLGGPAGAAARTYGRSGDNALIFEGVLWDQTFGDYGTYEEVQMTAAAKGAEAQSAGLTLSYVVKSGGNDFHGTAFANWQDGKFQSNNVTHELLNRGFAPGDNKFTHYNDLHLDIGGPIMRDRLWFYAAFSHNYSGLFIPGFISEKTVEQVEFFTRLENPTVKLTYQLTNKMKLESLAQLNRKWAPYRTGSAFVPLEATQNQLSWTGVGPTLKWTYIMTPKMTVDAAVNRSGYWWPDKPWTTDVRRTDLTTGQIRGARNEIYRRPIRWQWNGAWSWFTDIGGRNNELKTGFLGYWNKGFVENIGYPYQQVYRYRSRAGDSDYFLRPDSVQVYDWPNFTADGINYNSWFLNDKITWNRKLTMNVGLRFDRYSSWLPEQGNPGTGPFATKNLFPEDRDFPVYNKWSPRISLVYDVTGEGKLALKASYGRYGASGSGRTAASGPTANRVNPAATTIWTYSNWDGTIPYGPRPEDLAAVSGGRGTRRMDTNLKASYLDEYTAGVEVGFSRDYTVRFNVVRKMDFGGFKTLNLATPSEAFADVRYGTDPGRDNVVGTADDGVMEAWSVPRSHPGFGKIDELLTNVEENEGNDLYTAYETTFNKQYSDGWSFLASYTAQFAKRRNTIPQNPNELIYNWQLPEWHYAVKINGTYDLPWGLLYAATFQAQSGEYFTREAQMRNALNRTVRIRVEGQAGRYDWVKLLDSRLSKTFQLNDRHSIEAMLDFYNVLNASTVLEQVNTNGPDYLKPLSVGAGATVATSILPPRIFRLGVRWKF